MITKTFDKDFFSHGGALTLRALDVSDATNHPHGEKCTRTHESGWTISGIIHEDYYEWVNEFEASHPVHGKVWGDFEGTVNADSEDGFSDFWKNHEPEAWDYYDI